MTAVQKKIALIVICAILLFSGYLFWPFIYIQILQPIARLIWLMLRIFILSINQTFYWGVMIIAIALLVLRQIWKKLSGIELEEKKTSHNVTLKYIEYWRNLFFLSRLDNRMDDTIKRELLHLLLTAYASQHGITADYHVMDDLQSGQIALPENIHTFLFPEKTVRQKKSLKMILKSILELPGKRSNRRSHKQKEAFYKMIDDVLLFLESSLEIKRENE